MARRLPACVLIAGSLAALPAMPPAARASSRPAHYTADQAARGAALYAGACAVCHGAALEGGFETPPLTGRFVANWFGNATPGDLAAYIRKAMPQMAPGTLSNDEVAALVAFLLQKNGAPTGRTPLPDSPAALRRLRFPTPRAE